MGGCERNVHEKIQVQKEGKKKEGLDVKSLTSLDEWRWERGEGRGGQDDSERLKG